MGGKTGIYKPTAIRLASTYVCITFEKLGVYKTELRAVAGAQASDSIPIAVDDGGVFGFGELRLAALGAGTF